METIALTYRELAERLGIKPESARKTAQRRRWHRTTANDGTTRIHVPVEALGRPRDSTGDSPTTAVLEERIRGWRLWRLSSGRRTMICAQIAIAGRPTPPGRGGGGWPASYLPALRQPAALASASEQNHRSPYCGDIFVLE